MLLFRRSATMAVALVLAFSSLALMTDASMGRPVQYSGTTSASPNPATTSESVTITCSWNAFSEKDWHYDTVLCSLDWFTWYYSTLPSGTASKVYAAGSLSLGSHTLTVKYAVGVTKCNAGMPGKCYKYATYTTTLTINPPGSVTIAFHVYQEHSARFIGMAGSITFNGQTYVDSTPDNPQTTTVAPGQAYLIQANTYGDWPFFQWVTTTDGSFDNPSTSSTYFHPVSTGGIIALIVWNYAASGGPFVSGYTMYSTTSLAYARAIFTIPSSNSFGFVSTRSLFSNPNWLNIGVELGGVNGDQGQIGAGVAIMVPQSGTSPTVCVDSGCYTITNLWMCPFSFYKTVPVGGPHYNFYCSQIPNISGGHQIDVQVGYSGGYWGFFIQDLTTYASYNPPLMSYTPDQTTSEWGVFTVACVYKGYRGDCWGKPTFAPIQFSFIENTVFSNLAGSVLNTHGVWGPLVDPPGIYHQCVVSTGAIAQTNPSSFTAQYTLC